uniref:Uncharacterized protein n=1 Tax=Poecilia formosa TaxID=48698 RepID=A0A087XKY0_POEFO
KGRGARTRRPGQACCHFALVGAPSSPACSHGGKGRVWVVAEGVGGLQRQRLDAVRQQAAGRIVIFIGEIQLVGAWLLNWGNKPALGGSSSTGILALRGEEAVGLGDDMKYLSEPSSSML